MESAKGEIMSKLESVCASLEEKLVKSVQKLEEKVGELEEKNSSLRSRMETLERYERGDCLEIHNVPKTDNENTEELVLGIADAMGMEITSADISTTYRLPVKKEKQPSQGYMLNSLNEVPKDKCRESNHAEGDPRSTWS